MRLLAVVAALSFTAPPVRAEVFLVLHLFEFFRGAHFARTLTLLPLPAAGAAFSLVDDGLLFVDSHRRRLAAFGPAELDFRARNARFTYRGDRTATSPHGDDQAFEMVDGPLDQALEEELDDRRLRPDAPRFARFCFPQHKSLTLTVNKVRLVLQEFLDRVFVVEEDAPGVFEASTGPASEFLLTYRRREPKQPPLSSPDEWPYARYLLEHYHLTSEPRDVYLKLLDHRLASKLDEAGRGFLPAAASSKAEIVKNLDSVLWQTEKTFTPYVVEVPFTLKTFKLYGSLSTKLAPAKGQTIRVEVYLNGLRTKSVELANLQNGFFETPMFFYQANCVPGAADVLAADEGPLLFVILQIQCLVKR